MKTIQQLISIVAMLVLLVSYGNILNVEAQSCTTFAALHGALDTCEDDAYHFATRMQNNGWTPTITCRHSRYCRVATCNHLQNANATIVYWSGHGTTDGRFSHYTTSTAYHNYPRTHSQIVNGYINYPSSSQYFYNNILPLQTNSNTDWIILASCNQMTLQSLRNHYRSVLRNRSQRPMKGILGYGSGALAPDGIDNEIAKEFVRLAFNTSGLRRTTYAWLQANVKYGYYNATAMVNSNNLDDTLTCIPNPSNLYYLIPLPTIKYLYYTNKVLQIETASRLNNLYMDNTVVNNIYKINFTNQQLNGSFTTKVEKNNNIDIVNKAQSLALKSGIINNEYKPYRKLELNSKSNGISDVIETTIIFARYINGIRMSVLPDKGEQVLVSISDDGKAEISYSIQKQLNEISFNEFDYKNSNQIITREKAIEISLNNVTVTNDCLGDVSNESAELVYVIHPNGREIILAWETLDNYGNYEYIDALSKEIIKWPEPDRLG